MRQIDTTTGILHSFEQVRGGLPGSWLSGIRSTAMEFFANTGFPTPTTEAWKYTNLKRLSSTKFDTSPTFLGGDNSEWVHLFIEGAYRIVIRNGIFDITSSSIVSPTGDQYIANFSSAVRDRRNGVTKHLTKIAPLQDAPLVALNTALMQDGLVLMLSEGVALDHPVQVIHIMDCPEARLAVHPRTLVVAGESSRATIVETFVGAPQSTYWTNAVTEIQVGRNASVTHCKCQSESGNAFHTALTQIRLAQDARYSSVALATGAALSRNETRASFEGKGADCALSGGALLRKAQHADNTTQADHKVSNTSSRQVFRNVLDEKSHSVFQGGVIVRPDAQKTDSSQSNRNLLLSLGARVDTKPELQIFADDVKCAHGATVGDLDENVLHYLASRGIPPAQAKSLLIEAFVSEILKDLKEDTVRIHVADEINRWMRFIATGAKT